ncbi:MAG: hypothetical protein ACE10M_13280, partial [Alphaproteobacteria bacterium]
LPACPQQPRFGQRRADVCRGDIHSVVDERLKDSGREARPISTPPRPVGTPLPEAWLLGARGQAEAEAKGDTLKLAV